MSNRKKKVRLDILLVEREQARDLAEARALIMAGKVVVNDQRRDKPGESVAEDAHIRVKQDGRFVSRGGDKLAGLIEDLQLQSAISGTKALDIGASTGGFTDCLLHFGAREVCAVDVGTNQLAWELRQNPKVKVFEQTDIRHMEAEDLQGVQVVVADVSFQGLSRVIPSLLTKLQAPSVLFLLLVKPQFELPRELIPPGGIVEDPDLHRQVMEKLEADFTELGIQPETWRPSRVKGRQGNQEFFFVGTYKTTAQ